MLKQFGLTINDLVKKGFVYERDIGPSQIYHQRTGDTTKMILYHPKRKQVIIETDVDLTYEAKRFWRNCPDARGFD